MRAQMFKIAGVKNEKEFYKKFPTEAAFMKKHAKAFKKAQDGDVNYLNDLDDGNVDLNGTILTPEGQSALLVNKYKRIEGDPYLGKYGDKYGDKEGNEVRGANIMQMNNGLVKFNKKYNLDDQHQYIDKVRALPENEGKQIYLEGSHSPEYRAPKEYTPIETKTQNLQGGGGIMSMLGGGGEGGIMSSLGGVGGIMGGATDIMGGITGILEQKNVVKETEQEKQLTGLNADVMAMGDEDQERDYVRPEDIQNTGEEFFPIYGVGTNVLQKGGMVYAQDGDPRQAAIEKRRAAAMARSQQVYSPEFKAQRDATFRADNQASMDQLAQEEAMNLQVANTRKALIQEDLRRRDEQGLERINNPLVIGTDDGPTNRGTIAPAGTLGRLQDGGMAQYGVRPSEGMFKAQFGLNTSNVGSVGSVTDPNLQQVGQQTDQSKTLGQKMGNWLGSGPQGAPTDAQGNVTAEGMGSNAAQVAGAAGGIAGALGMRSSAGGQLGKGIGSLAGKLIPIPGMDKITGMAGEVLGTLLDKDAKKIEKNQKAIDTNMNKMMGMGKGSQVQSAFSSNMQDGGNMEGELQTHWGGDAETISHNPFLPDNGETVEFKGNMHNASNVPGESGIGASFGGKPVEVEGGEPATKLQDGGGEKLAVYGNLTISKEHAEEMGISKAAGKKAKNYVKTLSKKEDAANKAIKKNMKASEELIPLTSFDKLKQNSYKANIDGNTSKLKNYAQQKKDIASWQDAVNSTAQELGVEANALAKGKYKIDKGAFTPSNQSKNGGMYSKAQDGTIKHSEIDSYIDQGYERVAGNKLVKYGEDGKVIGEYTVKGGKSDVTVKGILGDKDKYATFHERTKGMSAAKKKAAATKLYKEGVMPGERSGGTPDKTVTVENSPVEYAPIGANIDPEINVDIPNLSTTPWASPEVSDKKGNSNIVGDVMTGINATLPYWRPTDKDRFDTNQLSGEMYALSHNALDPVKAQKFTPQLDVPYDISLQDQRNDISSATNAARRMGGQYNPGVMANIAAGEYEALNKVNAEEFRMNQAKKDQVYSGNRKTVDAANAKNLGILDQQYVRQSQAKSNTKEAKQAALNSISSKMQQHKLENKTLGTYENMYNYRFGNNDRIQSFNPLATFDMSGANAAPLTPEEARVEQARLRGARAADIKANAPVVKSNQDGGNTRKIALTRALKGY